MKEKPRLWKDVPKEEWARFPDGAYLPACAGRLPNQCVAAIRSSRGGWVPCRQRTNDPSGLCFHHNPGHYVRPMVPGDVYEKLYRYAGGVTQQRDALKAVIKAIAAKHAEQEGLPKRLGCAWCDWERLVDARMTDGEWNAVLHRHAEKDCPKHPLREMERELARMRQRLGATIKGNARLAGQLAAARHGLRVIAEWPEELATAEEFAMQEYAAAALKEIEGERDDRAQGDGAPRDGVQAGGLDGAGGELEGDQHNGQGEGEDGGGDGLDA